LYSIVWHIYEIKTGKKVSEYDAVTAVIKFIADKIQQAVEKSLNDKK
jgi:hypothetical protein